MSTLASVFVVGILMIGLGLVAIFRDYRGKLANEYGPFGTYDIAKVRGIFAGFLLVLLGTVIMGASFFSNFFSSEPEQSSKPDAAPDTSYSAAPESKIGISNAEWYVAPCKRLSENAPEFSSLEPKLQKRLHELCLELKK